MPQHAGSHLDKILKKFQGLPLLNPAFADYMTTLQKTLGVNDNHHESLGTFPISRWSLYRYMLEAKKPEKWSGDFTIVNMGCEFVEYRTDHLFRDCEDVRGIVERLKQLELDSRSILERNNQEAKY